MADCDWRIALQSAFFARWGEQVGEWTLRWRGSVLKSQRSEKQNVLGTGQANTAYAKYFIGDSFLNPLTDPKCGLFLANVTFEPGCRNNWHIHHATQTVNIH